MKITRAGVERFMRAYPHLCYGSPINPPSTCSTTAPTRASGGARTTRSPATGIDCGGEIWVVPDLNLTHHSADEAYPGNFHDFMLAQPGGVNDPARLHPEAA
jgi:hypothetical protein